MTKDRFEILLQGYLLQQLTEAELKEFFEAAALPEFEPVIKAALDRDLLSGSIAGSSAVGQARQSFERFRELMAGEPESSSALPVGKPVRRIPWLRYAAAVVLLASAAAWLWFKKAPGDTVRVQDTSAQQPIDVGPGGNRATLTLADGSTIVLDSSRAGMLAVQGTTRIEKGANGEVIYTANGMQGDVLLMNTMSTPRGGQYRLTLPDGSKVWLNAASSITYPAVFSGKERKVSVTGEAYFEVAKNAARPFIVTKGNHSITVLGTHFNVNAYEDEEQLKVTLLEGSVKVASSEQAAGTQNAAGLQAAILKPGQQALITNKPGNGSPKSSLTVLNNVQLDQVMAWKNGVFNFHKTTLQEVMRQLSRWYNVEVVYEKGIPAMEFGGEMGRDLTLAQVLQGFEDMEVHFRIETGNRLIVMP